MIRDEEHHDNRYEDEPVPRPHCGACIRGAHFDCFGCGCPCNADDLAPSDFDVGLGEIDAGGEEAQW